MLHQRMWFQWKRCISKMPEKKEEKQKSQGFAKTSCNAIWPKSLCRHNQQRNIGEKMLQSYPTEWTKLKFATADLTTHLQLAIKLKLHFKSVFLILVQLMNKLHQRFVWCLNALTNIKDTFCTLYKKINKIKSNQNLIFTCHSSVIKWNFLANSEKKKLLRNIFHCTCINWYSQWIYLQQIDFKQIFKCVCIQTFAEVNRHQRHASFRL